MIGASASDDDAGLPIRRLTSFITSIQVSKVMLRVLTTTAGDVARDFLTASEPSRTWAITRRARWLESATHRSGTFLPLVSNDGIAPPPPRRR